MKNLLFFLLFSCLIVRISAQTQEKETLEYKMFFTSREDAEKAFSSGEFRYYIPDPENIKAKPPRLAKGLQCTYVALEHVRENKGKSPSWVLLPMSMPAEFSSDGMPIVDGRCWNKIKEAYPLEKYVLLSQIGNLYGPPGRDGRNGMNGRDGYSPRKGIDYFDEAEEGTSFWHSAWPYVIGGAILIGGVAAIVSSRRSSSNTTDSGGEGPGGHTGPIFKISIFNFGFNP